MIPATLAHARSAALALALACALPACKGQDAAVRLTIQGPFLVPSSADEAVVDCLDETGPAKGQVILRKTWALTAATPLPQTVTYVEGDGDHPSVKFNVLLRKAGLVVGRGNVVATFVAGKTAEVMVDVQPQ
jgi:hypothetical protein